MNQFSNNNYDSIGEYDLNNSPEQAIHSPQYHNIISLKAKQFHQSLSPMRVSEQYGQSYQNEEHLAAGQVQTIECNFQGEYNMLNLDLEGEDFSDYGQEQPPVSCQQEYNLQSPIKGETEVESEGYQSEFSNDIELDVCLQRETEVENETERLNQKDAEKENVTETAVGQEVLAGSEEKSPEQPVQTSPSKVVLAEKNGRQGDQKKKKSNNKNATSKPTSYTQKSASKKKPQPQANFQHSKTIFVDTLLIGAGPAALGFVVNALKTGRLHDLIRSKDQGYGNNHGLAIVDEAMSFGGGQLGNYGINSNTSAGGFLKCMSRPGKKQNKKSKGGLALTAAGINQPQAACLNQLLKDITYNHKEKIEKISKSLQKQPQTQKLNSAKAGGLRKLADSNKAKATPIPDKIAEPEIEILPAFRDLNQSKIVKCMRESFGKQIIPLTLVGHFLNYVGNHLLFYINQLFSNQESSCKIFYPMHKAESVQLMQNGDTLVKVQKTDFVVVNNDDTAKTATTGMVFVRNLGSSQVWVSETKETIYFRAKNIVMANGGQQVVHPQFFNWFPQLGETSEMKESVITSDYFLKREGYITTMKKIGAMKTSRKAKIVIVGGSHSGFSCAWLMLHQRPAQNTSKCQDKIFISESKAPGCQRKYINNCKICCHCSTKAFAPDFSQKTTAQNGTFGTSFNQTSQVRNIESMTQIQKPQLKCKSCVCKCFGFFSFNDWKPDEEFKDFTDFKPLDFEKDVEPITILHRDDIKVFYKKVSDAQADGYTNFKKSDFGNEQGYLYSFTGLRGDAKELYKNVADGKEQRLRFVQAKTVEEQTPYLIDADIIIWACGYQTKFIPIFDMGNTQQNQKASIPLKYSQKQPGTQFDVDNQCRVMLENGVVLNKVHACGIAFPVKTNDGKTLGGQQQQQGTKAPNPRADGFSLYFNIVGDILLKNLLPKDKKKALGHKYYPMIENRSAILNQSPLKILKDLRDQQPSNGNFALTRHAAGDIQSSSKFPASDRFLVDHGKRLIKSNNTQSRQSKSQKRNTRMNQLHQIILSSEKEAPQPQGERMGEGLLNPQFMNPKEGCSQMKVSHADLATGELLRSQHSSEYSQDNLAQLPLQNQQQEAQTMNMNPKPQFLCGQNFKIVQNPLIFVNSTQVSTFAGQAKCMQPLVSQTPLVLLKQKMLEEEQQLELQDKLNAESVSTQIDEKHGPNFPLNDTSEVNAHLQSQVAGQGQPNAAALQGTLSKYIMNSKLVTQSPYVNEQLKRNISNIQKVQQRQHKKDKKDKRRSRLAHLSNGAEAGGASKLKEQTEIKQQDETDTTITYDENVQSRTFKLQPEMEQIPTARIKLHEQFDKGQKKQQRMTSKLKHQNSNSDCYKNISQSQKSQLTSNQVLYKKQSTLRHEKKSKEAGKSQVVKTLMSGGLLQNTKQQSQQHQVSQSSEALFPPIKNSHEQSLNDNEFYSRYSQKKGIHNVSQVTNKMTREECIQKVVHNQESKLCKQRLLSSNMNLSTKAGLCVHSPRVSGLAFRSGGRNSTKIDEIDFRIKSKSPFLAANLGKMKQADRLHSYGMLDDHSEQKNSESGSFKKDASAMKSDGDEPQLSVDVLSEHQNHSVTPAEPQGEDGLKHNVIVSSYFESLRNGQDSESDDQSKRLEVAQNESDAPTPSTQEIEVVHKTPKRQKNGAKELPSTILSPRLQPDLKKKTAAENYKAQSKKHKVHQQSVNHLDQRHFFIKESTSQKAQNLQRTVRKQERKLEQASGAVSGTSAISSSRGVNRKKSLSSEQMSIARLTNVHIDVGKKRNKPVKEASFGESTVREYTGQIKPLIMSNTIASGDVLAEDSAMQTVVRCDSSEKEFEAPQGLNSQDSLSYMDCAMASDKPGARQFGNQKKHEPREPKTPSHANFKEQRSPGSPHKIMQKHALQDGLRSSGFSKLSGSSTSAVKHPKTIEATSHLHKQDIDLLTPIQKSKKQTAVNVLLKQKKRHFINKEYSPVLLKQGLHRTPTDVAQQPRQLIPYGKPYKAQV